MSLFRQTAEQLRQAREQLPNSRLAGAADAVEEIRQAVVQINSDSDDMREAAAHVDELARLISQARDVETAIRIKIAAYLSHMGEPFNVPEAGERAPTQPERTAPQFTSITAPDESEYPDAAGPVVDIMPPRVRERSGRDKTVGYVDGEVGNRFVSGRDQVWSPEIVERSRKVGIGPKVADRLRSHVEMKVATKMIRERRTHSELVINHVPCGSQPGQPIGCDQALERYLPSGYTLTVHGTTQNGTAVTHTYKGQA